MKQTTQQLIPSFSLEDILNDSSPMPDDLIAPRILPPGGLLILNRTPKVEYDNFILMYVYHMAAGQAFHGLKPVHGLNIFYLQTMLQDPYLRERVQTLGLQSMLAKSAGNILLTPKFTFTLNDIGVERVIKTLKHRKFKPDLFMIDPISHVFDGGPNNGGINDIDALLFFIEHRVIKIRDTINPDAGIILVNHMNKITREAAEDGLFITPRGANSLKHLYLLNNKLVDKL